MAPTRRRLLLLALALVALAPAADRADAKVSRKKAIWGPVAVNGVSQFPIYRDLGAGIYHTKLGWNGTAASRPANPRDPRDPAYRWPAELDLAVREAGRHRMQVAIVVTGSPAWANGGREPNWAPRQPQDFAFFMEAAARRYPSVRHWMIWGEPSRSLNWMPLIHEKRGHGLGPRQRRPVRNYARLLDAAYGRLKKVSKRNLVIGGNTFVTGDVSPRNWIRYLRLANGKPPRMDLYGHNPFSGRRPDFSKPPLGSGFADFSDLPDLYRLVQSNLRRSRKRIRLFLSEFFLPTDHANHEFNFHVTRPTQASWLKSALRRTRHAKWIYTLGWFSLYDDPPQADGLEVNRGLIDITGRRKPSYYVFKRG